MKESDSPDNGAENLPLQILKKFRLIFGSARQHFRQIEKTCGISSSQIWILQEAVRTPNIGVSDLAERLGIHQSTCSQLVEKLVAKGYLVKERSKEDQRRVGLLAMPRGREVLALAPGPAEGLLPEVLNELPPAVLASLDANLSDVIAGLSLRDGDAAHRHIEEM